MEKVLFEALPDLNGVSSEEPMESQDTDQLAT
jgi:hypothetical protein